MFSNKLFQKFGTSFPFKVTSGITVLFISLFFINHQYPLLNKLDSLFNKFFGMNNYNILRSKRFGRSIKHSKEHKFAMKNGGELGGISNEGNTCFMNSVIQSLASSSHLMNFIDGYLYETMDMTNGDMKIESFKTNRPISTLPFTTALKTLLDNVNGKYGTRSKEFSTKQLLNKMPNGPKQNFFTGYNQEDAQEFYQLVMNILEKEYKKLQNPLSSTPEPESEKSESPFVDSSTIDSLISGCQELGKLGSVYVPASQVDPNLNDADHKVKALELITPVDGVSVERIGCLTCGETGGIRYSVNSGLSLNLPQSSSYAGYKLEDLLKDWITPEIIEDVNCNRCGLEHTRNFLIEKIEQSNNEKVTEQFRLRLQEIDKELHQPCVTDEAFEKLTIKQMTRKSKKSKQILLSRPPPLLAIHINRSVFDPRTYMIVKNSSNVAFQLQLDLTPYVAEPKDVNMDARKPFRKQDERIEAELKQSSQNNGEIKESIPEESDSDANSDTETTNKFTTTTTQEEPILASISDSRLVYNLKAVISHYGTHNYGHYICYRKLRGTWWRISDESVYIIDEEEVLNSSGTFMLFYEFDNGQQEQLIPLDENDLSDGKDEEDDEEDDHDDDEEEDVNDEANDNVKSKVKLGQIDSGADLYDSDSETNKESISAEANERSSISSQTTNTYNNTEYDPGEERAFHM